MSELPLLLIAAVAWCQRLRRCCGGAAVAAAATAAASVSLITEMELPGFRGTAGSACTAATHTYTVQLWAQLVLRPS